MAGSALRVRPGLPRPSLWLITLAPSLAQSRVAQPRPSRYNPLMPKFKENDRVRIATRETTPEDRMMNRYFDHMAGLTGTVQNVYGRDQIAVKIDVESAGAVARDVHKVSTKRMREKFASSIGEEQKKELTKEELEFTPHYMLLLREADLESLK